MVILMKYSSNYSKIEIVLKIVTVNIFLFLPSQLGGVTEKKWVAHYSSDSLKINFV